MRATEHCERGRAYIHRFAPGVVAATTTGEGRTGIKLTANEDSLAIVRASEGALACAVADSHFGPWAGETVAALFAEQVSTHTDLPSLLRRCEDVIARQRVPGDDSETTALAVAVRGDRLFWASAGDSILLVLRADGTVLAPVPPSRSFLGATSRPGAVTRELAADMVSSGVLTLFRDDLVLIASDGIEPDASGISRVELACMLRDSAPLCARVERLIERGGSWFAGGGGDNLSVVVLAYNDLTGVQP